MARAARSAIGAEGLEELVVEVNGAVDVVGPKDPGRIGEPEHVRAIAIGQSSGRHPQRCDNGAADDAHANESCWLHGGPLYSHRLLPGLAPSSPRLGRKKYATQSATCSPI